MTALLNLFGDLGFFVRRNLSSLGLAARMFVAVIVRSGFLLKRPRLVIDQILFVGNHSFVIIAVSGLFVGFVLGLQGYYTLNRYGSEQALGLLVALYTKITSCATAARAPSEYCHFLKLTTKYKPTINIAPITAQ